MDDQEEPTLANLPRQDYSLPFMYTNKNASLRIHLDIRPVIV